MTALRERSPRHEPPNRTNLGELADELTGEFLDRLPSIPEYLQALHDTYTGRAAYPTGAPVSFEDGVRFLRNGKLFIVDFAYDKDDPTQALEYDRAHTLEVTMLDPKFPDKVNINKSGVMFRSEFKEGNDRKTRIYTGGYVTSISMGLYSEMRGRNDLENFPPHKEFMKALFVPQAQA